MISVDMAFEQIYDIQKSTIIARTKGNRSVAKTLWTGDYVLLDSTEKSITWAPAKEACDELYSLGWFRGGKYRSQTPNCKIIRIEKFPKHGKVEQLPDGSYKYSPHAGYLGKDKMQFIADAEGKTIWIMWSTSVVKTEPKGENS